MSLKDFSKTPIHRVVEEKKQQIDKKISKATEFAKQIQETEEELVKDIEDVYSRYAALEEEDLIKELKQVTSKEKASGNLSNEQIDNAYNTLYPMLDENQRERLDNIIKLIK